MKYIIFDKLGLETPLIFEDIVEHSTFQHLKIISAGEVTLYGADGPIENACSCNNDIEVSAFGKSVTLGVKSRPEDAKIIHRALTRHYN